MSTPQKLASYKSFHLSTVESKFQSHFIADNEGMVHLTASAILLDGNWSGNKNKIMDNVDDQNASKWFQKIATHNQVVVWNMQQYKARQASN